MLGVESASENKPVEAASGTKPAEMSFNDWKKLKSALHASVESRQPRPLFPARTKNDEKNKTGTNTRQQAGNDLRNLQTMLYFDHLKQNNIRNFGGNMGMGNNIRMGCFNIPMAQNTPNMGNYMNMNMNSMQSPNMNRMQTLNMMSFDQRNKGNNNPFSNPRNDQRNNGNNNPFSNPRNDQRNNGNNNTFSNPKNDKKNDNANFMMPQSGIPQKPYQRMTGNFRTNNGQKSPWPAPKAMTNKKNISKKSTEVKENKKAVSEPVKPEQVTKNTTTNNTPSKKKAKKIWNPKPTMPLSMPLETLSRDEKKQMWRDYRLKMKPFKNREFHNAKRVIQRLGKKNVDELDEKEKERLTRAKEVVTAHKNMLTEKAAKRWSRLQEISSTPNSMNTANTASTVNGASTIIGGMQEQNPTPCFEAVSETNNAKQATASGVNSSNQWEIWNSFIPGGVLFQTTE